MADWTRPLLSDLKVDVLDMLKLRDVDAITLSETPTSPPTGAVRWSRSLNKFQTWSGTAWVDLVISHAGGGTGATTPGGIISGLGLGTMSTQNSNAVSITGGSITGLSALGVSGNLSVGGLISAGAGQVQITDGTGYVRQAAIDTNATICNTNENEAIAGSWGFTQYITSWGGLKIQPGQASAGINRISFSEAANSSCPAFLQAYEPGVSASNFIIGNNYYGINGGASGRINTTIGASAIRLGQGAVDIFGYNAAGTVLNFMSFGPTAVYSSPDLLRVGSAVNVAMLNLNGGTSNQINFYVGGALGGRFHCDAQSMYMDYNNFTWRSGNGATAYASLNNAGTFAVYLLQVNSGYIYGATGVSNIYVGSHVQTFSSTFYISSVGGAAHHAVIAASGMDISGNRLNVSTAAGAPMSMWKSGANAVFSCHQGGAGSGATLWHNAADTEQLMILNGNSLTPHGGLVVANGVAEKPILRFTNYPTTGIYVAAGNPTAEFGANFDNANRALLRCWLNKGKVDLYCGTNPMIVCDSTRAVHCGVDTGFYLGDSIGRWHTVFALNGTINTSDVRMKDVHGDLANVLPFVEAIQPIIGSFKEELRPETMKDNPNWGEHFPTFSAQDIRDRIDSALGTRIVDDTNPDQLGMNYSRLVPVLWQAVRELCARVKALEN